MAAMPEPTHSTVGAIYRSYEERRESAVPRMYLGMSELGEPCSRRLWYGWRECGQEDFPGRLLRLFGTGLMEEPRVTEELRAIGVTVLDVDESGQQYGFVACNGHLQGHMDGAVLGLIEAPKTWHVLEIKTHNAKSFAGLQANGVKEAKPRHYAQMQLYMGSSGMDRAAYFAVNKDTDEIYLERVKFDPDAYGKLLAKAQYIVDEEQPPPRLSEDPSWFECRYCPHRDICHGDAIPAPNCRNCAYSTPVADGKWHCEHYDSEIPDDVQRVGCDEHRFIPAIVEKTLELESGDMSTNAIVWRNKLTGAIVRQPEYHSREFAKAADKRQIGDERAADGPASDLGAVYESPLPPTAKTKVRRVRRSQTIGE
jgi:hypothetical protein